MDLRIRGAILFPLIGQYKSTALQAKPAAPLQVARCNPPSMRLFFALICAFRAELGDKLLLGLFDLITFYEVIVTVFDFNFKYLVGSAYATTGARTEYLAIYGMWTGLISLFCVFIGVSRIQKFIGVGASLMLLPILVAVAAFIFQSNPILDTLFWIMVLSKAFNYALNQPTMKQLYIPTSKDAKYKSQAFIEMYGSRGSKALGSGINNFRLVFVNKFGPIAGVAKYMALCAYSSIGIIGIWLVLALYIGKMYTKAVEEKRLIV